MPEIRELFCCCVIDFFSSYLFAEFLFGLRYIRFFGEDEDVSYLILFTYDSLFTKASLEGGEKIAKQCVACHSLDNSLKIKVGPPLWGIVNRKAASIDGFKYSILNL